MEEGLEALELLRSVTHRLAPLTSRLGAMAGVRTPAALPEPASARGRRGRRKQASVAVKGRAPTGRVAAAKPLSVSTEEGPRACAVIGCDRPSRSKGYCSAHYQKLRLLMRTNRRPAEWRDDAPPHSVQEVTLPRGRAASKALRESAETVKAAAKGGRKAKAAGAKKAPSARSKSAKAAGTKTRPKKASAKKVVRAAKGAKAKAGKRKKGSAAQGSLF
ncbi:cell wall protein [Myxococcus sp. Y35]|uniref:cell wall protein n=1 Tax=Pseudomyxococcus flavus TaxID=3115648 RepID=UPI003CF93807